MKFTIFKKKDIDPDDKKAERVMNIFERIEWEYPELMTTMSKQDSIYSIDVVRAYYELKMMESQKSNNKIMIVLTALNVVLVGIIGYLTVFRP